MSLCFGIEIQFSQAIVCKSIFHTVTVECSSEALNFVVLLQVVKLIFYVFLTYLLRKGLGSFDLGNHPSNQQEIPSIMSNALFREVRKCSLKVPISQSCFVVQYYG